jgi:heat shock protein HslJ
MTISRSTLLRLACTASLSLLAATSLQTTLAGSSTPPSSICISKNTCISTSTCTFEAQADDTKADDDKADEKIAVPKELVGDWQLTKLGDQKIELSPESPDLSVAAEGKVSGSTGVNRFGGMLAAKAPPLFGPLFTTRRAGEPAAMKIENDYVKALSKVTSSKTEGEQLQLLDAEKKVLLTFQRKKKTDE